MNEMTIKRLTDDDYRCASEGDLELSFPHGMPIVIPRHFHAALLAALLEQAGAGQVSVNPDAQGYADLYPLPKGFPIPPDDDPYIRCWLLPIVDGGEFCSECGGPNRYDSCNCPVPDDTE